MTGNMATTPESLDLAGYPGALALGDPGGKRTALIPNQ